LRHAQARFAFAQCVLRAPLFGDIDRVADDQAAATGVLSDWCREEMPQALLTRRRGDFPFAIVHTHVRLEQCVDVVLATV
jgi:hypothetical protein